MRELLPRGVTPPPPLVSCRRSGPGTTAPSRGPSPHGSHPPHRQGAASCPREGAAGHARSSNPQPEAPPLAKWRPGRRRRRALPAVPPPPPCQVSRPDVMRVHVLSDLHTDYRQNMEWLEALPEETYRHDVLITAGDIADSLQMFEATMRVLARKFGAVFFVPGNHDLWVREAGGPPDSLQKLKAVLDCCEREGVWTAPRRVGDVWIVPLFSWHHQSFDTERDIEGVDIPPLEKVSMDYKVCKWPPPLGSAGDSLARHFDEMNAAPLERHLARVAADGCQVITFSHFLPRLELCPEKRMLFYPHLPKIVGSHWLEARVRAVHGAAGGPAACHVFGHTHFCWDSTLDGIRYVQAPLAYPSERAKRVNGGAGWLPFLLYDSSRGGLVGGPVACHWSDYYRAHAREPDNTELAPWVAGLYESRAAA